MSAVNVTALNIRRGSVLLLSAVLASCAVGPNYVKPDSKVAPKFEGAREGAFSSADAQGKFWTQFGDDTLNRLVDEALDANHDLRIALGRLIEARAIRREAQFDLAPTVTAAGGYTKEQFPAVDSPTGAPLAGHFYQAGFDAFWELDSFGRVRRGVEARHAEVEGAEASLRDAQVSVTAEVARTYFELRGAQTELTVALRNVDNQRETTGLTQVRLDAGRGTELDTSRARSQLSTTLATIGPLQAQVARSIHRLAVLTGREPNALNDLLDRKSTRLNSSHVAISYAVFCLKKKRNILASISRSLHRIDDAIAITYTGQVELPDSAEIPAPRQLNCHLSRRPQHPVRAHHDLR